MPKSHIIIILNNIMVQHKNFIIKYNNAAKCNAMTIHFKKNAVKFCFVGWLHYLAFYQAGR